LDLFSFFHNFKKSGNLPSNVAADTSLVDHLCAPCYVLVLGKHVLCCTSKSKNAMLTEGPGTEHGAQDFYDTSNQRPSSVTETQPDCS